MFTPNFSTGRLLVAAELLSSQETLNASFHLETPQPFPQSWFLTLLLGSSEQLNSIFRCWTKAGQLLLRED